MGGRTGIQFVPSKGDGVVCLDHVRAVSGWDVGEVLVGQGMWVGGVHAGSFVVAWYGSCGC